MNIVLMMFCFIMIVIFLILLINWIFSMVKIKLYEKNSSFECGFELFNVSRLPFSIHFYLIGILFLVFDVEIILLFPMLNSLKMLEFDYWLFCVFFLLLILYLGLEFEMNLGVLKWMFN